MIIWWVEEASQNILSVFAFTEHLGEPGVNLTIDAEVDRNYN